MHDTTFVQLFWLWSIWRAKKRLPLIAITAMNGTASPSTSIDVPNQHQSESARAKRPPFRENTSTASTVQSSDRLQPMDEELDENAVERLTCFSESPLRWEDESCRCINSETSSLHGSQLLRVSPTCRQHGWVNTVYSAKDKSGTEDCARVQQQNNDNSGRPRPSSLNILSRKTWSFGSRLKSLFDLRSVSPEDEPKDRPDSNSFVSQKEPAIVVTDHSSEVWSQSDDRDLASPTSLPDPSLTIHSDSPEPRLRHTDSYLSHATFVQMIDGRLARRLSTIISLGSQEDCHANLSGRPRDSLAVMGH